MQKRFALALSIVLLITGPVVHAEDPSSLLLTDDQIVLIKTNCLDTQSTLQRVHSSDALARFNLGQQYNIISTNLMAPMNSRIALNKLDGVSLTQTTVTFNNEVDHFNAMYQQYEQTMQRALKSNCKDEPVSFFDTINLARDHRAAVRESVDTLNMLLKQYDAQLGVLKTAVAARTATAATTATAGAGS